MFVHSGASLHGHEFSNRASHTVTGPGKLRNPLLRSAFSPGAKKVPAHPLGPPVTNDTASNLKEFKNYSKPKPQTAGNGLVNSEDLESDTLASQSAELSEHETSLLSDADVDETPSLVRRKHRSRTRKSTTYVLAHPPPRIWKKQRIINIRPSLVLQIQKITSGLRPRPAIDVFPSSAVSRPTMASLLKRYSSIAGIKKELSIHDIMLVRSEDYDLQPSGPEIDGDEDAFQARDLLALISPSKVDDRAEIVMADGMVWVATTRSNGSTHSYQFTSNNALGGAITARWVRRQKVSASLPGSPTSQVPNLADSHLSDSRFTFSFINPNYRRHPVLATLTNTSLTIPDSYTAISDAEDESQPLSESASLQESSNGDRTRTVEEWQKSFISISAVWVALRNGWVPNFRPPFHGSVSSQLEDRLHGRRRSISINTDSSRSLLYSEVTGLRRTQLHALRSTNNTPRRGVSLDVSHVRNRSSTQKESDDSIDDDDGHATSLKRRALSSDWNVGLSKRIHEKSLVHYVSPKKDSEKRRTIGLAPPPIPAVRRAVSVSSPLGVISLDMNNLGELEPNKVSTNAKRKRSQDRFSSCRCRKWKIMRNWFRKLSER